ncbi:MAG: NAD-dependent epimerase/dehydratase family protein [Bacteroidales bacterium]|nr:NAD-dependent epimerase/dehydratase family protein [Bacteroidales bacterium]
MIKILITGANSFVGRNFINNSRFENIREVCLIQNNPEDIDFSGVDVVLHLAAIVHQSQKIPDSEYFKINRDLAVQVAERAKREGVKHFIFLSTVKVYGEYNPKKGVWSEYAPCEPYDAYGKSKYEAELKLKKLESLDFIISIIRPPLVYGVGVKANMLSIIKLVDSFPILPFKKVKNKRSFTAVENLVELIDSVINKKASGIFLPMDENPLSTTELVKIIAKSLDKKVILFHLPRLLINVSKAIMPGIFDRLYGSFEIDNSNTRRVLDYNPVISTEEGIQKMVEDYIKNK